MIGKKIIKKVSKKDQNTKYTIWKFHDFSTTQILREINVVTIEAPKMPF